MIFSFVFLKYLVIANSQVLNLPEITGGVVTGGGGELPGNHNNKNNCDL